MEKENEGKMDYVRRRVREIIREKFRAYLDKLQAKLKAEIDAAVEEQHKREEAYLNSLPKSELVSGVQRVLETLDEQQSAYRWSDQPKLQRKKGGADPIYSKMQVKFKSEIARINEMIGHYDKVCGRHSSHDYDYIERGPLCTVKKMFKDKENTLLDALILASDKQAVKVLADLAKWEPTL